MNIFFLEKLRKIYKSLGKKEKKINDLIKFKKFKRNSINYKFSDHNFNLENIVEQKIKFVAASVSNSGSPAFALILSARLSS